LLSAADTVSLTTHNMKHALNLEQKLQLSIKLTDPYRSFCGR